MNRKEKEEIINLATFVLIDEEFKKLMSYIELKKFNNARLLIEEKKELLEATSVLYTGDDIVDSQIQKCNRLEDILTDIYIESLVKYEG